MAARRRLDDCCTTIFCFHVLPLYLRYLDDLLRQWEGFGTRPITTRYFIMYTQCLRARHLQAHAKDNKTCCESFVHVHGVVM
jgi:hypothetical protein